MTAYRSPLRESQAAATRARIVEIASQEITPTNLGKLTFADVARRAKVSERTVYRHFPTLRELQDAVVAHMERSSGWTDDLAAGELGGMARKMFSIFGYRDLGSARKGESAALRASRERRYAAMQRAIEPLMPRAEEW